MSVHRINAWCTRRPEDGARSRTGVTDSCKPPYGCWESNLDPLEEQAVFLTTDLPLHPQFTGSFDKV